MSVKDQSGKDPEIGQEVMDLRKLYDDVLPPGKVIISVTDKDLVDHHAIVPIPKSYEAAMAIAFDQLGEHIATIKEPLLKDVYFKYSVRCPSGEVVWAKLAPEFWKEVVKDGDQLKLFRKLPYLLAKIVKFGWKSRAEVLDFMTAPLPKTYQDAKRLALATFYPQHPTTDISLFLRIGTQWVTADSHEEGNWMRLVAEVDKKDVYIPIGVRQHQQILVGIESAPECTIAP
jgi:hypothetical protein